MKPRPEQQRIKDLKQLMKAGGVRALVITRREDVRYLTGFTALPFHLPVLPVGLAS